MQTECQKQDGEGHVPPQEGSEEEDSGDEGEQDEMLFEYSTDVLAPLGNAMKSDEFLVVFKNLLPHITNKTVSSGKPNLLFLTWEVNLKS